MFDFVADERNEPRYNVAMVRAEQVSDGPIGVGTRLQTGLKTRPLAADLRDRPPGYANALGVGGVAARSPKADGPAQA